MAHLYILRTAKNRYYIGSTDGLESRIAAHRSGKVKTTKSQLPVQLVFSEYFTTRAEAQRKEYRIKGWKSKKLIDSLIQKSNGNCVPIFDPIV